MCPWVVLSNGSACLWWEFGESPKLGHHHLRASPVPSAPGVLSGSFLLLGPSGGRQLFHLLHHLPSVLALLLVEADAKMELDTKEVSLREIP